ncbi:MAG: transglutaminase-like domain-containing protein [Ilumatobacter sp.]|uniref:transglutaminase-like domain-containing protein n=1 Tax=Ilumatobacter sp. TaxID=1967498 RepID=UPI00261AAB20|nr:transglutaminase-like domain-containing protein [Ilumatobacter sp.]MDJ0767268.1 transglutaminase-like domain-containing protein [Ilumatobacter sp.]
MGRDPQSEVVRRVEPFRIAMDDAGATLDEQALALSSALQPGLDVLGALTELDVLAGECPTPTRHGVMDFLFGGGAFAGDRSDYHRWQNSCLDHVLASRRGIPITLSVIGVEVARRLGVELAGVGMPGHFLIGDPDDADWFVDPFRGTVGLDRESCRGILAQLGVAQWSEHFLDPTPHRQIIARMLNNLRRTCESRGDAVRLAIVMQARQVLPEFADERVEAQQALAVLN